MAQTDAHVRDWLKALGALIAPSMSPKEFVGRINILAQALAREYPNGAFCQDTIIVVARQCKFFPNYAEICDIIGPWWKDHRPTPIAITSDQTATVRQREIEREARESWEGITAEQVRAKIRLIRNSDWKPDVWGHVFGNAMRKHAPQHLSMLPPEWIRDNPEPDNVVALRRP